MTTKLNLGCGQFRKAGYINVDSHPLSEPDIRHNLNQFPYPWEDNQFSLIEADHVLEHLENPFEVMRELHRISKNGGSIHIKVPHFTRGFTHADHKRGFDVSFPFYFNSDFKWREGPPMECKKMRLRWFAPPYYKKAVLPASFYYVGYGLGTVFDFFANLSPFICSRLWSFWVGGFEEIEFLFQVKKSNQ